MPRLRKIFFILAALLAVGIISFLCAVVLMFPSSDGLPWPKPLQPLAQGQKAVSSVRLFDFIEHVSDLQFEGSDEAALQEVRKYKYLRDSPYLAADRDSARKLFSVAAGSVLIDEDLSQVAHASSRYEGRQAIYLPSDRKMTAEVHLPQQSEISFGFLALAPFDKVKTCSGRLVLSVKDASGEREIWQANLSATREAFSWQDVQIKLEPDVQNLRFSTEKTPNCEGITHAFLSSPRIFTERTKAAMAEVTADRLRLQNMRKISVDKEMPKAEMAADAQASQNTELDAGADAPQTAELDAEADAPKTAELETLQAFSQEPPLNVLYINICTLRPDDLGVYGNPWPTSPHIDALARDGARFAMARSNSNWSKGSQISALLGRYPSSTGVRFFVGPVGAFERKMITHLSWPSLPDLFRQAGYESLALVDNVFLSDFLHVGVDLGFEKFVDNARHLYNGVELTADAVNFIDGAGDRPFFLYINIANPHYKYRPPRDILFDLGMPISQLLGDLQQSLHFGEVAFADRMVGQLIDALEARGLRSRTLIVLHADHGEILEENRDLVITMHGDRPGRSDLFPHTRYKHGWTWFEAEQRVPLILNLPGKIASQVIERPVSLVDVAPTILKLVGLEWPKTLQGQDLFEPELRFRPSLLEGKQFDSIVAGHRTQDPEANWKLVFFHEDMGRWRSVDEEDWHEQRVMLFDLKQDPMELENVAFRNDALVDRLGRQLHDIKPATEFLYFFAFEGEGQFRGSIAMDVPFLTVTMRDQAPADHVWERERELRFELTGSADSPPILAISSKLCTKITIHAERDGNPLPATALSIGPYGLPLAEGEGDFLLQEMGLLAIGAGQMPQVGQDHGLRIWSQRINRGGPEPFGAVEVDSSVMDAMKDWGYAH